VLLQRRPILPPLSPSSKAVVPGGLRRRAFFLEGKDAFDAEALIGVRIPQLPQEEA
jgi:hypothetical protein